MDQVFDRDKMSWGTRIKLCWQVLTKGTHNPELYRTRHAQEQWDICRQRDKEMNECNRPRTPIHYADELLEQ